MQIVGIRVTQASFTVEAVFVMSFVVWIVVGLCYYSMYSHDKAVIYSLSQDHLEKNVENGQDWKKEELEISLKKYIQEHMIIVDITDVSIIRNLRSLNADIEFDLDVSFPFVADLLYKLNGNKVKVTHELLFAPYFMLDGEAAKKVLEK